MNIKPKSQEAVAVIIGAISWMLMVTGWICSLFLSSWVQPADRVPSIALLAVIGAPVYAICIARIVLEALRWINPRQSSDL